MRSSATAFLFSVPFFLQLLLGVALARACMREAGCRGVNGALRNLQARARAGRHLLRPCTFPRPHGIALRPGLLLPCPLLSHPSHLSGSFSFFPIHGCRCLLVHIHGGLVVHAMRCRESSWQSSRCLAPVLAPRPADSERCMLGYVFCVFQSWGLEC